MEEFFKAKGFKGASLRSRLERLGHDSGSGMQLDALPQDDPATGADLAWHVRVLGPVGAGPRPPGTGCLLSHLTPSSRRWRRPGRTMPRASDAATGRRRHRRRTDRAAERRIRRLIPQ